MGGGGRIPTYLKETTKETDYYAYIRGATFKDGSYTCVAVYDDTPYYYAKRVSQNYWINRPIDEVEFDVNVEVTEGKIYCTFRRKTNQGTKTYTEKEFTYYMICSFEYSSEEIVFKTKLNGIEYNKIKLNGEIITPKA